MTAEPYSFYKLLPNGKMCFFVDATLIKDFGIGERRFYLKHIQNLRGRGGFISFPISIGGWWSDVMEEFYNRMKTGAPLFDEHVQEIAMKAWVENKLYEAEKCDPEKFEKFGNLAGAILMLKQYIHTQYEVDRRIWKIVGAETGFGLNKEVFIGETNKVVVYWVGKPDLIVIENDRLIPVDHKTVTRIDGKTIGKYKPGPQMPGYCFGLETIAKSLNIDRRVDRAIVNICAREKPTDKPRDGKKKPRFIRSYLTYTREEIEEWRRNIVLTCERIDHCIRTNEWQWCYQSCHNIFMRDCEFLKADSSTPMARDLVLQADFQVSQPWQPYVKEKETDE